MNQLRTDIPMSFQQGPSAMEQFKGAMSIADMVRGKMEDEAITSIFPKYLNGNLEGDREGFLAEVQRINPRKAFEMMEQFKTVDEYSIKMQQEQERQDELLRSQGLREEGMQKFRQYQAGGGAVDEQGRVAEFGSRTPEEQQQELADLAFYGAYEPGIKEMKEKKSAAEKQGLFSGWKTKNTERDAIISGVNPYTKQKITTEEEKEAAWDMWERSWATSTNLGITPKYIEGAAQKASATSSAGTRAREETQRDVQREQPMFSAEQANKISQSALALKNLQRIRDALAAGNIQYFDIIKKTGQLVNPRINNSYQQVSEIVGRGQSGAAIAEHEWKNFGKEILNPQFLLTEQGRKTAIENLDDYIDRFYSNGELITADPEWYTKYIERGKKGKVIVNKEENPEKKKKPLSEILK